MWVEMPNILRAFIEENFSDESLIIVSNREPYIHKKVGSGIKAERPAGGLTSAMDDVMKAIGGKWVAWGSGSGDKDVVDSKGRVAVPPENPSYTLKRVWLNQNMIDNYYHGYSNQLLWPLCHITLDRVYFRKRFWEDYKEANRLFADAVIEEAGIDSVVWVHDFHLSLLPELIRERMPELTIAHFWHIPWPNWSVFRICPQSKEILEGLLGNDLIGFQIPLFVKNFLGCIEESLDADIDYSQSTITYKGHSTRLMTFPISVDYKRFDSMASSPRALRMIKNIKDKYNIKEGYIGIGVDRLEYTKALIKRLQAISLFFERYEKLRGRFTFIQIAVATRLKEPYISYKKTVEELISKINRRYSTNDWRPIIYIDTKVEHKDLVAYYRMADVAIISSVYDGMNLVAKEYVASQVDEKGVLILSELAGAAEELEGALLINPYDIEGFSTCIRKALTMPLEEKKNRMALLRNRINENDIYKWISNLLHEILKISSLKQGKCPYLFDQTGEIINRLTNGKIFLFLDYDGTLTPIVESPDEALISDEIRNLIIRLKGHVPVAVITGRSLKDIKKRVGIEGIVYAGNHGAEIWDGKEIIINQESATNIQLLNEVLNRLKSSLSHIQGILIEDKNITASIHYRMVNAGYLHQLFGIFRRTAMDYEGIFKFNYGKKVIEIRPVSAWDKGDAVGWIIKKMGEGRIPVYIGDDATDEDAFRAIKDKGISICVGGSPETDYFLKGQEEVIGFLKLLLEMKISH